MTHRLAGYLALVWIGGVLLTGAASQAQDRKPPQPKSTADVLRDANEARQRNDLQQAVALFTTARKAKDFAAAKPSPELILAVGDYHFAQGSFDSQNLALETYDLATTVWGRELSPFHVAQVRTRRAEVLSWQGKVDLARDEINALRAAYKGERRVNLLADLASANLLLLANQSDAARDALRPLTELNDDIITPAAMFAMGRAYVQLKQPDQAIAMFRTLWNRYGESEFVKRAVYLIGQVYFDRGDFLEARKLYEACAVVGASMQTRVRPGDDLIVKVADPDYFARTRARVLTVTLTAPSGDEEPLRLEKNPVSDQLYVGRIQTALLLPRPNDGQLQVAGNDVIRMSYIGQTGKPYEVRVVDDGSINVDSVALAAPTPRHERSLPKPTEKRVVDAQAEPIVLPTGKLSSGAVSPGSPIYVQVVDADHDTTADPDTVTAEVLASHTAKTTDTVTVTLTETGGRTGVFTGTAVTEALAASAIASSEAGDRRAYLAIDQDPKTFWKAKPGDLKEGQKHFLEIDLRQPAELAKLTWGPSDGGMPNAPTAMRIFLRGDGADVSIEVNGKPAAIGNAVDLKKTFARTIRLEFDKFGGDAPAIGQIAISDSDGNQLVPTGYDPNAPERKEKLAFDVGHQVYARVADEENDNPGSKTTRESRKLGVRYHNAGLSLAKVEGDGAARRVSPAWRLDREGQQQVVLTDPDVDTTPQRDSIKVLVQSESGDAIELPTEETGPATGTFMTALPMASDPGAMDNPRLLRVSPGDLVWMSYLDDRNMTPGYRTHRHQWVLDNQATGGDFAAHPLVVTAWPFEVKPTAEGEMQAVAREMGHGRVLVRFADNDTFADATRTLSLRINALLGETSIETVLQPSGPGYASRAIDLILGDKEAAGRMDAGDDDAPGGNKPQSRAGMLGEINVSGDDLIRIAASDERVANADLAVRSVMAEQQLLALAAAPRTIEVVPLIKLSDPLRRVMKMQDERLEAFRTEMGVRLLASRLLGEQLLTYRRAVETRLAFQLEKPDQQEQAELLKRQLNQVDAQIAVIKGRTERLAALGAVEAKAFASPKPADAEQPAVDPAAAILAGPLMPGKPFDVVIDDPDVKADKLLVRLRSVAGRLVDVMTVDAARQPDGTYTARIETERSSERADTLRLSLLPGGEVIVDYQDTAEPMKVSPERVLYLALASDASVRSLNSNYVDDVSQIRLGQEVYIEIVDFDADRSGGLDGLLVRAKSSRGDQVQTLLTETEPHSGIFRGLFRTDFAEPDKNDDVLQAGYGGSIDILYDDYLRLTPESPLNKVVTVRITGGSDGRIEAFGRQFRDSREEMDLWYRTGQAAYQVGRKLYLAGALARAEEHLVEATDYFDVLVTRFPDDPMAASSNYYLGNIQALRGNHREALARFQEVVTRWPKSEFVARARFKIGQAHEGLGQFEQAADAYVLLTYHHPSDEHVPLAMIRMMNRYARTEEWSDAVAIAQRFVEKFPAIEQSGAVALKAGQWLTVSGKTAEALTWYTSAEKTFATSDRDMPALLYWHAATMIQGGRVGQQGARADKIRELLNRVVYDYPRNEYAGLARIALEQINQQN